MIEMLESLFNLKEKCGRYIKGVAIWTAIIETVSGLITAIWIWWDGWFMEGLGFLIFMGSALTAIVTMYFLYGFGSLVEDMHVIRNRVETIKEVPAGNVKYSSDSTVTMMDEDIPEL